MESNSSAPLLQVTRRVQMGDISRYCSHWPMRNDAQSTTPAFRPHSTSIAIATLVPELFLRSAHSKAAQDIAPCFREKNHSLFMVIFALARTCVRYSRCVIFDIAAFWRLLCGHGHSPKKP